MPINKDTLQEWIDSQKRIPLAIPTRYSTEKEMLAYGAGTILILNALKKWAEDNACNHPNATYLSHTEGIGMIERDVYKTHSYCPDCGKKL